MTTRTADLCLIAGAVAAVLITAPAVATAADAQHGRQVFKQCSPCHAVDRTNRVGPGLGGVAGRRAGSSPGFHYSRAMKRSGIVWDDQALDAYLKSPQTKVPGNVMPFSGIPDATDRADLIAYLDTLK